MTPSTAPAERSTPPAPPFPVHARSVVRGLRSAFAELLAGVGADPANPQDMSRRFRLNKNLTWKISKIIQADDPAVALQQMPGAAGTRIFLQSLEKGGGNPAHLAAAKAALAAYEELITVHSGDRATLEIMGAQLSPNGSRQIAEHHRRMMFQGAGYVWGVQARVMLKVGITGPGEGPGLLNFAALSGLIDFRRLRDETPWAMATRYWHNDDGSALAVMPPAEAIDPRFNSDEMAPLMGDFCSQPLLALRRCTDAKGTTFELEEGPVGNTGALTSVLGTFQKQVPLYRTPENELGEHTAICDTPAELLIADLFIHESFAFAIPPEVNLYSELRSAVRYPGRERERNRLPLAEPLLDMGQASLLPPTPEVPRYRPMVEAMFDRAGWKLEEFHGFRMRIAYPAIPTALVFRYPLPQAPGA